MVHDGVQSAGSNRVVDRPQLTSHELWVCVALQVWGLGCEVPTCSSKRPGVEPLKAPHTCAVVTYLKLYGPKFLVSQSDMDPI